MIPKKIHYCWLGGNPLPESAKKCIKSWRKYCPDYEIIEWNESNYDFTKNAYMREALQAKKWGFVPDYARLDIIYQQGGIYLDTDVEIVNSFDDLLEMVGFAGFESEQYVALGLGFGAEKGNPLIKKLMHSYEEIHFIDENGELNITASPELNTDVLEKLGLNRNGMYQEIDGFVFLPTDYLCPKSFNDGILRLTKNTHSIHHFDASWCSEEVQKEIQERWKIKKKKQRIKNIRTFAKQIGMKVLGEKLYRRLRKREK